MQSGRAFVFINYLQALKFGHVGWGFAVGADTFVYGSADHLLKRPYYDLIALLKYSYVEPGGDIDFWSGRGSYQDMLAEMSQGQHIYYHAFKEITVSEPRIEAAAALVESTGRGGWALLGNNCVNQAGRILSTYGAEPDKLPQRGLIPRRWFKSIAAEEKLLRPRQGLKSECGARAGAKSELQANS